LLQELPSNISYLKEYICPVSELEDNLVEVRDIFGGLPPGIIPGAWRKGRGYYARNLAGPKPTKEIIQSVDQYLFYGDPSRNLFALGHGFDAQRQWVINNILLDGSPARSQASYRKLPFEVKRRARLWGDRVADCLDLVDETDSIEVLKTAIVSLKALLFTAPSDCDAQGLRSVIRHLRMVLSQQTTEGCWGVVR
jgi:hypothetical protein